MLVLSRKCEESVVMDGGIEVVVLEVRGDKVKLGFTAPSETAIRRKELTPFPRSQGGDELQEVGHASPVRQ